MRLLSHWNYMPALIICRGCTSIRSGGWPDYKQPPHPSKCPFWAKKMFFINGQPKTQKNSCVNYGAILELHNTGWQHASCISPAWSQTCHKVCLRWWISRWADGWRSAGLGMPPRRPVKSSLHWPGSWGQILTSFPQASRPQSKPLRLPPIIFQAAS